jgi:hypothetical protein
MLDAKLPVWQCRLARRDGQPIDLPAFVSLFSTYGADARRLADLYVRQDISRGEFVINGEGSCAAATQQGAAGWSCAVTSFAHEDRVAIPFFARPLRAASFDLRWERPDAPTAAPVDEYTCDPLPRFQRFDPQFFD